MKRGGANSESLSSDSGDMAYQRSQRVKTSSSPCHYHQVRRRTTAAEAPIPIMANHFEPLFTSPIPSTTYRGLCLLAAQPSGFPEAFLPTTVMLIVDTGASISITPSLSDFVSPPTPVQPTFLKGIASGLQVRGIGTVSYTFQSDDDTSVTALLPNTLYVPECSVRLLCPRHLAASTGAPDDGFMSQHQTAKLTCQGKVISASYHTETGLPIIFAKLPLVPSSGYKMSASVLSGHHAHVSCLPTNTKPNLSNPQRQKLLWHERLNHRSMPTLNRLIRRGLLPVDPSVASCPDPICAACQFGKAHRKSHERTTNAIAGPCTAPGQGVSADQLEAGCPGRIPTTKGLPTLKRYKYCNLWIDHYSRFVYPTFHDSKHASELVASKREFQAYAARFQVTIRKIRADNGVYSAGQFKVSCEEDQQDLTFCAVGGHWQNGVAERYIGVITQMARTILLHAIMQWPTVLSEEFWPFAIRHACTFHNASVDPDRLKSPHQLFTGEPAPWRMQDFRVFGCPVFVLDKRLQDGDSLPKWKSRCWTGIYVGHSLQHAGNVPLVYNPATTHVSPQYHVTFDDQFTTVTGPVAVLSDADYERLYHSTEWMFPYAFGNVNDLHLFEDYWSNSALPASRHKSCPRGTSKTNPVRIPCPQPPFSDHNSSPLISSLNVESTTVPSRDPIPAGTSADSGEMTDAGGLADAGEHTDAGKRADAGLNADAGERSDAGERAEASEPAEGTIDCDSHVGTTMTSDLHCSSTSTVSPSSPYINLCEVPCTESFRAYKQKHGIHAHVYTAHSTAPITSSGELPDASDKGTLLSGVCDNGVAGVSALPDNDNKLDILTQAKMFKAPDAAQFIKCQVDEINSLYDLDIMDARPIETLPPRARLLSSIWSYRRKRLPNGVLSKYKSRLCVNGKEQSFGRDYWETYAPVAAWPTIRLLLYLSTILNLHTRQVDYTSAFPQADLDVPVYMRVPQGWYVDSSGKLAQHNNSKYQDTTHYLKLKKNLYGCKQAARNWFKMLSAGLRAEGFIQSTTDSCLFLRNDCIIVVYVDDCLFFAPTASTTDSVITALSKNFKLKDEGDVSAFLGVQIRKHPVSKTISFTQPGLIDQLLRDLRVTEASVGKDTPVDSILHPDPDGPERTESWNYRSAIGKLNYLANHTRPDISMAVHQCARFCTAPKALHELAVKRIVRYLLATKTQGLLLRPNRSFTLDMFVDADFAGRWHKEFSHLRESVLSRTGYVVTFCGCPISWASKLQSEIALSTTESEYIALSTATRELLPLRRVLHDILTHSFIHLPTHTSDSIHSSSFCSTIRPSTIFEDNSACIVLATSESNFKPRTKHISLKFHHFQDQIRSGNLRILKVESAENWADIFTKPLGRLKFEYLRRLIMGW